MCSGRGLGPDKHTESHLHTTGGDANIGPVEHTLHRRRIKTEETAKVVAAVWGTELIQFHAALANLH